jgi:hypothetical protein
MSQVSHICVSGIDELKGWMKMPKLDIDRIADWSSHMISLAETATTYGNSF